MLFLIRDAVNLSPRISEDLGNLPGKAWVLDTDTLLLKQYAWNDVYENLERFMIHRDNFVSLFEYLMVNEVLEMGGVVLSSVPNLHGYEMKLKHDTIWFLVEGVVKDSNNGIVAELARAVGMVVPRFLCKHGKYLLAGFNYRVYEYSKWKNFQVYLAALYNTGEVRCIWGDILKQPYMVDCAELSKIQTILG